MSFTSTVKDEISKLEIDEVTRISELSGIIQSGADISESISITTENNSVARRIYTLIKDIYGISPKITVRKGYNYSKKMLYILEVKNKVNLILKDLGIGEDETSEFILGDSDLVRAYLRGVFDMCASINDPKTSRYHLEFNLNSEKYAKFICDILNSFDLKEVKKIIKIAYRLFFRVTVVCQNERITLSSLYDKGYVTTNS